jgi:hypothetical protein
VAEVRVDHPPLASSSWRSDRTGYQFSRGGVIEIVAERRRLQPGGDAADLEYLYLRMSEEAGRHTIGEGGAEALRLVRIGREEFLYRAVGGWIETRFSIPTGEHIEAEFELDMRLTAPAEMAPGPWKVRGRTKSDENVTLTQGLINRYEDDIRRLGGAATNDKGSKP